MISPLRRAFRAVVVSLGFLPFSWGGVDTSTDGDQRLRIFVDSIVQPLLAEHEIPGLALAITVEGQSYFFNYGVASKEGGQPVDENTIFEVGSVSKTFTATLAAYAQAMGRLSLDEHPSTYLPELRGTPIDAARLVHLGTYTAGGLPLQVPDDFDEKDRLVPYFQQWRPSYAPGEQRVYSNPSIGLLGHLTALALKREFTDAIELDLLPSLGLTQTFIRIPESAKAHYAWGYNSAGKPIRVSPGLFDAEAYGIKSTSRDLLRFVQVNIDPSPLLEPFRQAIALTQEPQFDLGAMVQGLGWEQYPYPLDLDRLLAGNSMAIILQPNRIRVVNTSEKRSGAIYFNKTGSTNGFGAYVAFVPERRIGIVVLANKNYPIPARLKAAHAILEFLTQPR